MGKKLLYVKCKSSKINLISVDYFNLGPVLAKQECGICRQNETKGQFI